MSHYLVLLVSVFSIVNPLAATRPDGMLQLGMALLAAALVALSIWLILGLSGPIAAFQGTTGMNVATRFKGLVLAAIAVEFLAAGLADIFPAWTVPASAGGMGPG